MKFIIRDDDLNYFSSPDTIKRWYSDIFKQGIKVSFSVIPFVKPTSDVYPKNIKKENVEYPISLNKNLVDYIKSNPLIYVMQHGCTHETKNNVFEFRNKKNLFQEVKRGKIELEKTFNKKIKVFVPPHDSIYSHGILAIENENLNIIRGTGSKNIILEKRYIIPFLKMLFHRLKFPKKSLMPAYPFVVDFGKHKEAYSNRLTDNNFESILKKMKYTKKKNGIFILTAHLHDYNEKRKNNLLKIINVAKEMKARFISSDKLFN